MTASYEAFYKAHFQDTPEQLNEALLGLKVIRGGFIKYLATTQPRFCIDVIGQVRFHQNFDIVATIQTLFVCQAESPLAYLRSCYPEEWHCHVAEATRQILFPTFQEGPEDVHNLIHEVKTVLFAIEQGAYLEKIWPTVAPVPFEDFKELVELFQKLATKL